MRDINAQPKIFSKDFINYLIIKDNVFEEIGEVFVGELNNSISYSILPINDETTNTNTANFTASIDKWGGGVSSWLDGPVMKLHSKDNDVISPVGIDLSSKSGHPGHKHKPDMDKGSYELRVEHNQNTDGAINIDDVMGVLSRSRGIERNDEWRFYDKENNTSLWDNATKINKMDIILEEDKDIELSAILRGDVNASYNADDHDRADPSPAPTPSPEPLPLNNDDELLTINPDIL